MCIEVRDEIFILERSFIKKRAEMVKEEGEEPSEQAT